ncbi:keratin, type I cytoskeletal 20 [Tamandua tetradactyla]|uniref:keratin, type I cytoskeletal 20 n=1 Tax=Tamandua tetradactyla TaxID=48850 RepID=UPI0040541170
MDFSGRRGSSSQVSAFSESDYGFWSWGVQRRVNAPSVYGGAGGRGTRISTFGHMGNHWNELNRGLPFVGNEKMMMQNLNDRLAIYLGKVHSLEQSNSKLERKIKQWYDTKAPSSGRDYSAYYKQIQELRDQIKDALLKKARCVLQIDNVKLAAEDFKMKYETERMMKLTVEADIQGLKKVFDELTLHKTDLEIQIEELNKDLALLKKEHQEAVDELKKQLGGTVNVEMKAAPGLNLGAIINEMREKYEAIAKKHLQDAKEQFEIQIETLQQQITVNTEELKGTEFQIKEQRRNYQNAEIELKTQLSMKESLEHTLEETKAHYSVQLVNIQELLKALEFQLKQIRNDRERQNKEYNILLDIKTRLEQEIATYRTLLEGEDIKSTEYQLSTLEEKDIKVTRKITTVMQEVVDGKVVSSEVKEIEENV